MVASAGFESGKPRDAMVASGARVEIRGAAPKRQRQSPMPQSCATPPEGTAAEVLVRDMPTTQRRALIGVSAGGCG
jgi:hypothetical protein